MNLIFICQVIQNNPTIIHADTPIETTANPCCSFGQPGKIMDKLIAFLKAGTTIIPPLTLSNPGKKPVAILTHATSKCPASSVSSGSNHTPTDKALQ